MAFFFSSRRRHTRLQGDWSSDVCSSDLHDDVRALQARREFPGCARHAQLATGLKGADVVMMLRIQKERMGRGDLPDGERYFAAWGLTRSEERSVGKGWRSRWATEQ